MILLQVTLAIHLAGAAAAPPDTLARAQRIAAGIFAQAGVRLLWTSSGRTLEILDRSPTKSTGFAIVDAGYAAVSYPQAVIAAADCDQPVPTVLGAAIAHEIGHLILGPKSHSTGVMSPRLGCRELRRAGSGELRFQSSDARLIRAALSQLPEPAPD